MFDFLLQKLHNAPLNINIHSNTPQLPSMKPHTCKRRGKVNNDGRRTEQSNLLRLLAHSVFLSEIQILWTSDAVFWGARGRTDRRDAAGRVYQLQRRFELWKEFKWHIFESVWDLGASRHELCEAILCFCGCFSVLNQVSAASVVQQNAATLFYCEAPELHLTLYHQELGRRTEFTFLVNLFFNAQTCLM